MKSSVRIIAITTTVRHKTKSINYVEQILKKIQKKILSPLSSKMSEENLSFVVLLSLVQTRRKIFQVCTVLPFEIKRQGALSNLNVLTP